MSKVELVNGKVLTKCCICSEFFNGHGNNPEPMTDLDGKSFDEDEECCDKCNTTKVIPFRMREMGL